MKDLYIGVFLAFFSAFNWALGSILVQLLEQEIPDLQLNFYRSVGQTSLSVLLLVAKGLNPLSLVRGKECIIYTVLSSISGALDNVFIFASVLLIPVGSAGSLFHAGSIIFSLLGVWIFRMEKLTRRKIIVFLLTLVGISLTLFSVFDVKIYKSDDDIRKIVSNISEVWMNNSTNYHNGNQSMAIMKIHDMNTSNSFNNVSQSSSHVSNTHDPLMHQVLGVTLALGGGLGLASFTLGEKKASLCDHPVLGPVMSFWMSAAGLPISILLVPIMEERTFVSDMRSIVLVIGHSIAAGFSVIFFCLAVDRAPVMVVILTMTADIPIRVLAQYLVIPDYQPPGGGLFDIIGSVVVTIALCLPAIWELMDKKKDGTTDEELTLLQTEGQNDNK